MLSEASDVVICYALLLPIKANVETENSACDYLRQQQSPLCVVLLFEQVFIFLTVQIFHAEVSQRFVVL